MEVATVTLTIRDTPKSQTWATTHTPTHTHTHTHMQIETTPSQPLYTLSWPSPGFPKTKELYPLVFPRGQVGPCPLNNTPPHGPQLEHSPPSLFFAFSISLFLIYNFPTLLPGGHESSGLRYHAAALMMHNPWWITHHHHDNGSIYISPPLGNSCICTCTSHLCQYRCSCH